MTIGLIRKAVQSGNLKEPFTAAEVNLLLRINWGGNFLAKHSVGNRSTTELFIRVDRGLYRLKG